MAQPSEFVIRPNGASHLHSWPWIFALLAVVCVGIAARFAWLGYWLILPFAMLEITAVGLLLVLVARRGAYVEKIRIQDGQLVISHLQHGRERRWCFPAGWARVELAAPGHRWYNRHLLIGSSGQWVVVGECLTDSERAALAEAVRRELHQQTGGGFGAPAALSDR